jgi:hypothetical protein
VLIVSFSVGFAHCSRSFAHLLEVCLLQHSSLLGLDDSVASLRTSGSRAPRWQKVSVLQSLKAMGVCSYALLGLGLDLLLDRILGHCF